MVFLEQEYLQLEEVLGKEGLFQYVPQQLDFCTPALSSVVPSKPYATVCSSPVLELHLGICLTRKSTSKQTALKATCVTVAGTAS